MYRVFDGLKFQHLIVQYKFQISYLNINKFKLYVWVEFYDVTNTFSNILLFLVEYLIDKSFQFFLIFFANNKIF